MLKRILVPLDGSACATHAFQYALGLAKAESAALEVCAIVDPFAILGRNLPSPLDERHVAAAKAEADAFVGEALEAAAKARVAATACVGLGEPAAEIVARASSSHADTIVMGTHGRSGFKRLFMGSVAEEVLRSSPCPVVVVREKAELHATANESHAMSENAPLHMLRLIEVAPERFERLYGEIASFMSGPGADLPGVVDTQIFGSVNRTRICILAQFRTHHDWVRAQWDARLGELLEEIAENSETLEFNLYSGDRFAPRQIKKGIAAS